MEKEFNLSEKRKGLYEEMKLVCSTLDEEQLLDTIFLWLNKQDKEFIKRLKEEMNMFHDQPEKRWIDEFNKEKIDKLAGEELSK